MENEISSLRDLANNLNEELEGIKKELTSKNIAFYQMQDKCKNYADQLNGIRQEVCVSSNNFIVDILDEYIYVFLFLYVYRELDMNF